MRLRKVLNKIEELGDAVENVINERIEVSEDENSSVVLYYVVPSHVMEQLMFAHTSLQDAIWGR